MQIVIDIPNTIYQRYLKDDYDLGDADVVRHFIQQGTPLPKGHGRIGDLDALEEEVSSWGMNDYEPLDFIDAIDDAPTIIEADNEVEE